ncbi:MAG: disulfide bond formation protein B [Rhodanobacteraceae bacterium]
MNPFRWSFRTAFVVGLLGCIGLLAYALFAEKHLGLEPCNLCILQRVAFLWMALWFLVGGLHAPKARGRWAYVALVLIGAAFGIAIAIRQLWLQSLPAGQVPVCGASFPILMAQLEAHAIPLGQFITVMLRGDGDCAKVTWRLLGLSMAGWTLIWYVLLGIWSLLPRRRRNRFGDPRPMRALRN